ncbi:hypothetical protein CRE_29213 [Caenorhabditis remanei]|uniref:Uncharacterized protein n=1 Tax=Caenorhabditis remanei TaxID=31234 RepID=E3NFZ4_CAERE|nr:hypothetical protein CRE_29213 [Caenorhabditis remanei]
MVKSSHVSTAAQRVNHSLKNGDEGKRLSKVKVQGLSETLVKADFICPDLDAGRSGTSKGGMKIPFAPDSGACRSDASGDGAKREVPTLDASRSGASNIRIGLKSSGPGIISDSGSPRNANSLAFDGTPRPDTPRPVESATDLDVGRSGTPKEGMKIPSAPDSDACRSGTSGDGADRKVPTLDAGRSGASNIMDDLTKPLGPAISHGDDGPPDTVNQSPGVSYPMMSARPDGVDLAKARLSSHRVRPSNPRIPKAKLACYACITQTAGPQTPRSVDSLLVPESGSCPTPN